MCLKDAVDLGSSSSLLWSQVIQSHKSLLPDAIKKKFALLTQIPSLDGESVSCLHPPPSCPSRLISTVPSFGKLSSLLCSPAGTRWGKGLVDMASLVLSHDSDLVFSVEHNTVYVQPSKPHVWKPTLSPLDIRGDTLGKFT